MFSTHRTSLGVRQHTQDVHCCLWLSVRTHRTSVADCVGLGVSCVSVSTHRTSVAVHQYTYQHAGPWTEHAGPSRGLFGTSVCVRQHKQDVRGRSCVSVCVRQHTQDVHGCLSVHRGRPWLSISTHISTLVLGLSTLALPVDCSGDFGPRGLFVQYTHDVCGCPSAHTGRPCVSVSKHRTSMAVRVCPSAHTRRLWLSISTHISTLVLGLSTLTLPIDCSGDFGLRGLFFQYTQDVRGTHSTSVAVHQYTYQHVGPLTQHAGPSRGMFGLFFPWWAVCSVHTGRLWVSVSTHRTSVCVRQHTQNVRVCPSAQTGCLRTVVLGLSTLALPVDYLGDFGPRGLFVQYTQDGRRCPSAHTGRPCVSFSKHRTSVAVRVCPSAHTGRPWLSISTHISTLVLGLSTLTLPVDCSGDFGLCGLSIQYTEDVRGCPPAHTGRLWLSVEVINAHMTFVAVRVCPSAYTGRSWLSIIHIGHLWVSVSTHKTSVCVRQHTQNVRGRSCVSVCVRQHTQDVHGCPSVHRGRPWLSISTHISTLVLGLSTLALPVDCLGDFGPHGLSIQYTQDVRGCPPAHTGRLLLSVSTHRTSVAVLGVSTLALPVDCLGDFGPRGLSVQYTQDVRGCPPAHTGRLWLSVSTHRTSVAVLSCLCVFVSTHTGRLWQSISTHISTLFFGLSTLALPVDCSGRLWLSFDVRQHIQDVRGCLCVSVSSHRTSVAVHQYTYQHVGPLTQHAGPSRGLFGTSVGVRQHTQDVRVCPSAHTERLCVSVSTNRTSVAVRLCPCVSVSTQRTSVAVYHTHRTFVGVHQHTGRPCVSVSKHRTCKAVRVCPSAHTRRPWLSISTHISTLVLGLSTLTLPVDCSGDFGPRGLFVQYTQDVRGCPPEHTGRMWLSVAVRQHTQDVCGCLCVSVSTHSTSVAVHQYTYQHVGPLTQHAGPSRGLFGLFLAMWAVCSVHRGRLWVSVSTHRTAVCVRQHTQNVCVCPSAQTGRPQVSVSVRVCPSAHTGRLWLSISTHISTLVLGLSTLALPVDCLGDFGPRGLSGQYTHDGRRCPSTHTGRPCVSFSKHRTSVAVRVCPSAYTGRSWLSISTHISTLYTEDVCGCVSAHTGRSCVSVSTHRTSVCVRQHKQDVRGRSCVSVCVRQHTQDVHGCPSVHRGRPWLSISTHISTLVLGLSTLALPVDCLGDFGPHGLSIQYTQDVRGCPPTHTGRPLLSVSTHRTSVAVRSCLCVSVSTHTGRLWLSIRTHISMLVLGLSTLALPVDCLGDSGPRELSVQYTQDVRGSPPAHTGRLWLSVSTHRTSVAVLSCLCVFVRTHTGRMWLSISTHISTLFFGLSTLALPVDCSGRMWLSFDVRQHIQDVRGCLCVSVSSHRTSVAVHQYTYQQVGPLTQHAGPSRGLFGMSVGVRQHTQDVRVCLSAHTERLCVSVSTNRTSVAVRLCPCVSVSTQRTSVAVHQYTYQHAGPSRGPFGLFWHTWAVCSVHTGRPWVSISTHRTSVCVRQQTQDVQGCTCVSVSTHKTSVAVHQYTYQHVGPWTQHAVCSVHTERPWVSARTHRTYVAVRGCPSTHTGRLWLSVCVRQHTQHVCGCPSVHISALHTGRPWVSASTYRTSVAVCGCKSAHTGQPQTSCVCRRTHTNVLFVLTDTHGCPVCADGHTQTHTNSNGCTRRLWLSISTHISTLVLGLSTLALPVDCLGDFGPRGLSVQYTQDVSGCSPAHTRRLWLSVSTHRMSVVVRSCLCVSVSTHTVRLWLSISTHISTLVLGLSTLALPVDCSGDFGPRGLSVQYTQDVCGCPSAHTGRLCVSVSTNRTSDVRVQYTQDVRGCPPAHTGRPWLSVSTHRTSVAVRVCPSAHTRRMRVSVSINMTSVCVR
ncbi:hypothetical protein YC2023_066278 [Brassica napus]